VTLGQAIEALDAEVLAEGPLDTPVTAASASDLLSDVLAFTPPGALLLTGLVTIQAVRTAELVDAAAVCFVAGMRPQAATVAQAGAMGIPLCATTLSMFEACGRLYERGLRGTAAHNGGPALGS
jgi:hypothetical protein